MIPAPHQRVCLCCALIPAHLPPSSSQVSVDASPYQRGLPWPFSLNYQLPLQHPQFSNPALLFYPLTFCHICVCIYVCVCVCLCPHALLPLHLGSSPLFISSWCPGGYCRPDTSQTNWEERTENGKEKLARKRLQQKRIMIGNRERWRNH